MPFDQSLLEPVTEKSGFDESLLVPVSGGASSFDESKLVPVASQFPDAATERMAKRDELVSQLHSERLKGVAIGLLGDVASVASDLTEGFANAPKNLLNAPRLADEALGIIKPGDIPPVDPNAPIVPLPKPQGDSTAAGVVRGVLDVVEGVETPGNIPLLGLGAARPIIQRGALALISSQMAKEVPAVAEEAGRQSVEGTAGSKAEANTKLAAQILLPSVLAKTGMKEATPLVESVTEARQKFSNLMASGKVREAITVARDAADTKSNQLASEASNDIRGPLRREFGKEAPRAEEALTFVVESAGSKETMTEWQRQLSESENANPEWRDKAIQTIEYAKQNLDRLKPVADRYSEIADSQHSQESIAGIESPSRRNYVMHAQDVETDLGFPDLVLGGKGGDPVAFKKMRTYDTYADSIDAGVDPHTLNAVDLLHSRVRNGQQLITRGRWIESVKDSVDPSNNLPIATDLEVVKRPDGTSYSQPPSGYKTESFGGRMVAVQKGYAGLFEALTDPSKIGSDTFGRTLQRTNATGKSLRLMLDTFHLGRVAYWDSFIRGMGLSTFELPLPKYRRGLTLLDNSVGEIRDMAAAGEIPDKWVDSVLQDKARMELLTKAGTNFGGIADAMHQEWIRKIPVLGNFNKFLFEQFQRGAMSEIGLLEFERQRGMFPELTDTEVARRVAKDVNTRFGNLGRQGWLKSRTNQDIARLAFLAPQWNEGLIRSEFGAVKQLGESVYELARNRRLVGGMLGRSVGGMIVAQFAANQLLNLYTRGHPTWDNPEEGLGAKLSAWIPDKIGGGPGFFLHPAGLAAEMTHLFTKKLEQNGDMRKAVADIARSRASQLAIPAWIVATGKDYMGRTLKPGDVLGDIVKESVPVPIAAPSAVGAVKQAVTGENQERFPGEFQKQLMSSVGIRTDQAPMPGQRIAALARDFNKEKGITPSADFFGSDYSDLNSALKTGNKSDAQTALTELLKTKTEAEVLKHFKGAVDHPFTGQKRREREFLNTLNDEQLKTYQAAVDDRKRIFSDIVDLIKK